MTPDAMRETIIDPALAFMANALKLARLDSTEAGVMILAIFGQEGDFQYRRQIGGTARSFAQFEAAGARGVMVHPASSPLAHAILDALDIPTDIPTVHEALAWNDHLAVAMARLLLWTDPAPLPAVIDAATAWTIYLRLWRPGKPGPDRWAANHAAAVAAYARAPGTPLGGMVGSAGTPKPLAAPPGGGKGMAPK